MATNSAINAHGYQIMVVVGLLQAEVFETDTDSAAFASYLASADYQPTPNNDSSFP